MQQASRIAVVLAASAALAAGTGVATAKHVHGGGKQQADRLFTLQPEPAGNPEGVAFDKRSKAFFVSITNGGAIYRGTLGDDTVRPFIDGARGRAAIGVKVRRGKLYVAGGPTGSITVYDLATRQPVATFQTGTGGFLNDLVVTRNGDVYVTDSFRPTLWHVTAEQVRAGSGTPQALDVSTIPYEGGGAFNVNGIVARNGRTLVVVDTNSGKLFRIRLADRGNAIRDIDEIEGAKVPGGDGMLLDRGRLVVVQGDPAQLSFLKLRRSASQARLVGQRTSPKLRGPSTVARARQTYLVVNADFGTSQTPFTVAGLSRHRGH